MKTPAGGALDNQKVEVNLSRWALFGGFTVAGRVQGSVTYARFPVSRKVRFVTLIPGFEIDTERSNWTYDPTTGQYYWHRFMSFQPDLNYRCRDMPMATQSSSDDETLTPTSFDAGKNISLSIQQLFVHPNKRPAFIDIIHDAAEPLVSSYQFTEQFAPDAEGLAPLRQF